MPFTIGTFTRIFVLKKGKIPIFYKKFKKSGQNLLKVVAIPKKVW